MSYIQNNSIFWVEVDKISPNPFQPRRDFDSDKLKDLAESIKMYGLLQPLTVTRKEEEREDGSLVTTYELIAGERRLRASRLAGLVQVPVIIRSGEEDDRLKLELAIIENLQRDDLNPVERAIAFQQLVERFGFKHGAVAKRVGKSREYVSNTIRLLSLPEEIKKALSENKLSEGHTRPILMLRDRPKEQVTLFKEIIFKKLTVREAEAISRRIAYDKVRKQSRSYDPELVEMEDQLAESLGTRVFIEKRPVGGKITIDFFSNSDLKKILELLGKEKIELTSIEEIEKQSPQNTDSENSPESFMDEIIERKEEAESFEDDTAESIGEGLEDDSSSDEENQEIFGDKFSREDEKPINFSVPSYTENEEESEERDKKGESEEKSDGSLYSISDFTI